MSFTKISPSGSILFFVWVVAACTIPVTREIDNRLMKRANYHEAIQVGYLANKELYEASGLACSRLRADVLWAINDGGSGPFLYAINTRGAHLGKVHLLNAQNQDWEDLASFRLQDIAYLLIADVGDNSENRADYSIYFIREPTISDKPLPSLLSAESVEWERRLRFIYEDGSHDCESVAVDLSSRQILLLSKRAKPPTLYMLPLVTQTGESLQVAKKLSHISVMPQPTLQDLISNPKFGYYHSQPTAMDVSPNGATAVILTYKNAYLFQRARGENWPEAFIKIPQQILLPKLRQAEALCFATDGKTLFVTSEKLPAPLLRLEAIR
ncbi:MAG: hypothetical protein PVI06_06080 [Desulfobacterales bacterium]|jgi:hypothetical protein